MSKEKFKVIFVYVYIYLYLCVRGPFLYLIYMYTWTKCYVPTLLFSKNLLYHKSVDKHSEILFLELPVETVLA